MDAIHDLGLSSHAERFAELEWTCLSHVVYATTYTPHGISDEGLFERDIIVKVLGDADHPHRPRLRRLYFEAFALSAAELRRKVEADPSDISRMVPQAELEERRRRIAKQLPSLVEMDGMFEPDLDVSDTLLKRCIAMYDLNRLAYIALELCTKRSMDLVGVTKDPVWSQAPNGSGFLRM